MNDAVVQDLFEYLNEWSVPPEVWWSEHWFEEVSYSRWAANELIDAILNHPMTPAEDTIWMFAMNMYNYAELSNEDSIRRMFLIAADFASECLQTI